MRKEEDNKLGKVLWKIANNLRGAMHADSFKDYMLSFLFLRYLSHNYEKSAKKELGSDYPESPSKDQRPDYVIPPPLEIWYSQNKEDIPDFEKQMQRKVHYVIKPKYLWSNITELAKHQEPELLKILEKGFRYIEEKSFESTFHGLFSEINLNSEKLGKTEKERNDKLCTIIETITSEIADYSTDSDVLGDAYEYLIGKFAAGSGKKAGEFYTPQEVSAVLSELVLLDAHDPNHSSGSKLSLDNVFDMACGSGSLLLNVRKKLKDAGGTVGKIYGQEKNVTTYNLARMNMLLHGMKDTEFEIFHGDTLKNQWDILYDMNPKNKMEFDAIVANPPFSLRWEPNEAMGEDFRFKSYGLAPKSAADFAFLLHGFHYLSQNGTMAIILPHGVLFRGGAEARIREKLLKDGNIDTVIGLPSNLFYSTGIPVCILVIKKCKREEDVLFINASEQYDKGKRQNSLSKKHLKDIIETYRTRPEKIVRYARRISMEEIAENDYNLNISRYVSTQKPEEQIDLKEVNQELKEIEWRIEKSRKEHNEFLKELGLDLI